MQGITGLKFIELAEGTAGTERLPPGSRIEAGQTMLEQLTGRASDIGLKVEKVLNNVLYITRPENRRRVDSILASTDEVGRQPQQAQQGPEDPQGGAQMVVERTASRSTS